MKMWSSGWNKTMIMVRISADEIDGTLWHKRDIYL